MCVWGMRYARWRRASGCASLCPGRFQIQAGRTRWNIAPGGIVSDPEPDADAEVEVTATSSASCCPCKSNSPTRSLSAPSQSLSHPGLAR
ncbi:hypothetical protein FIBSPDRAFT_425443 [Athelia psychrophila]|uniref:Uncharacterized protein n=1 Tax=Athelia psychrophila TaxID=1759441 RepID=A0A166MQ43_9AGAM|nr:hypothetical protein FIBSPDRAFT_425443 [Fibularhizoctonia sp. CBS 109695]